MIKGLDGSEYTLNGDASIFDPSNKADQALIDGLDQEVIALSGAPVIYYKVLMDQNFDDLYLEHRGRIIPNIGVKIYAWWEPATPLQQLGAFGIDSPDEIVFMFNLAQWRETVGSDMPTVGGHIYTPWNQQYWEIIQHNIGEFKLWGKHRLEVIAQKYQRSTTAQDPDHKEDILASRGLEIR